MTALFYSISCLEDDANVCRIINLEDEEMKNAFLKKLNVGLLMLIMIMALASCGKNNAVQTNDATQAASTTAEEMKAEETTADETIAKGQLETDREGNDIVIPEEINSIISLAPSTSEILIDLGLSDKIVAVDTNTQLMAILDESLPAFDLQKPDAEQILALAPDIIFVSGLSSFQGGEALELLKNNGICVVSIPTSESIDAIKEDIRFIAQVVGRSTEGESIISSMEAEIAEMASIGATISTRKTVYFEISPAPHLYSFGKNVFLQEMIEIVGAENIFADQEGWKSVNAEDVVAANPDVILSNAIFAGDPVPEILSRDGFSEVTAVKNQDVYYIDNNSSSIPSHNIVKALREMAEAIYPEYYLD